MSVTQYKFEFKLLSGIQVVCKAMQSVPSSSSSRLLLLPIFHPHGTTWHFLHMPVCPCSYFSIFTLFAYWVLTHPLSLSPNPISSWKSFQNESLPVLCCGGSVWFLLAAFWYSHSCFIVLCTPLSSMGCMLLKGSGLCLVFPGALQLWRFNVIFAK